MKKTRPHSLFLLIPLLAVLALSCTEVNGQTAAASPAPPAPALSPVPEYVRWVVTFQYPGDTAKAKEIPANRLRQIEVIKAGDTRRDIITYGDGSTSQFDRRGPYLWIVNAQGVELTMPPGDTALYPFYARGYTLMDWVEPHHYVDQVKYRGTLCSHYRSESQEAWIAVDSRLPVAATNPAGIEAVFRFYDRPTAIQLSAEEEAQWQRQRKAVKAFDSVR